MLFERKEEKALRLFEGFDLQYALANYEKILDKNKYNAIRFHPHLGYQIYYCILSNIYSRRFLDVYDKVIIEVRTKYYGNKETTIITAEDGINLRFLLMDREVYNEDRTYNFGWPSVIKTGEDLINDQIIRISKLIGKCEEARINNKEFITKGEMQKLDNDGYGFRRKWIIRRNYENEQGSLNIYLLAGKGYSLEKEEFELKSQPYVFLSIDNFSHLLRYVDNKVSKAFHSHWILPNEVLGIEENEE